MKNKIILGVIAIIAIATIAIVNTSNNEESIEASAVSDQTQTDDVANTDSSEPKAEEAIVTANPIKVGMSGGYLPYTYIDDDGELTGFDVDIWLEIGNRIGRDIEFVTSDFSGLFGMLDAGQITTIANQITVTESRLEKYIFSDPYVYYGAQLVVKEGVTDITDLESLKGKKVGVDLGTNYEEIIRNFDTEGAIEIITYSSGSSTLQDVSIGRIDAYINDKLALLTSIKESGLPVVLAGEPVETLFNAFPFAINDDNKALIEEVNTALDDMRNDGTLETISLKYFTIDISEE